MRDFAPSTPKNGNGGWNSFPDWKAGQAGPRSSAESGRGDASKCGCTTGRTCCRSSIAIPRAQLSPEEQVNYDVYRPEIEDSVADQKFRDYEMPANSDSAFWTDFGYTARRPFKSLTDYKNWIAQMRDIPRYFHEQIANMQAGLARGFTPPRMTLQGRDKSIATIAEGKAGRQFALHAVSPSRWSESQPADQAKLKSGSGEGYSRDRAAGLCRPTQVLPRRICAAHAHHAGGAKRCRTAKLITGRRSASSPPSISPPTRSTRPAWRKSRSLHAQMVDVMHETGFKGDFPAFLKFLREDPQFYAKTPQELLNRAAWIAKVFDGKASQYFGYLPRMRFTIKPVPPDLAPFYTSGRGGPGVYLLNTYDLPHRPLYNLTALTLHESAPGHAFQIPIALEHKNQPEFRQHNYISAYGEGWALYCEKLGVEMGMYDTPYDRFGMLGYQIWRAAGWSWTLASTPKAGRASRR